MTRILVLSDYENVCYSFVIVETPLHMAICFSNWAFRLTKSYIDTQSDNLIVCQYNMMMMHSEFIKISLKNYRVFRNILKFFSSRMRKF